MIHFCTLVLIGSVAVAANAFAEPQSIPGTYFRAPPEAPATTLTLGKTVASKTIALPALTSAERSPGMLKSTSSNVIATRTGAREIGVVRDVPVAQAMTDLGALSWQPSSDGGLATQITIRSIGAEAVRAELSLVGPASGLTFRFSDSTPDSKAEGPYTAGSYTAGPYTGGSYTYGPYTWRELESMSRWSPIVDGDSMTLEITVAPGFTPVGRSLSVAHVAHQDVSSVRERATGLKVGPGSSGSCNIDIACIASQLPAVATTAASSARISFVMSGRVFECSGQLINSTDAQGTPTNIPYFTTANHCISTATAAGTIQFFWFYQSATCRGTTAPTQRTTTGGAALLYTNADVDATLLRLNVPPPAGVFLVGWDATPPLPGTNVVSLHHPSGDYTKYSAGAVDSFGHFCDFTNTAGTVCLVSQGSYIRVNWTQGTTEGGSSGAGVYTVDQAGAYRLRGILHGGGASCDLPAEPDFYSRFDLAYASVSQFLAGVAQPAAGANAIEYYNVDLDHYFLTSFPGEATAVEGGSAGAGWTRTGYSFPVGSGTVGEVPVCRFYGPGPNSHFFTADAAECAQVKRDPGWVFEANAYNVRVPSGQSCPSNTIAILRTYNNGFVSNNSNHRYVTSPYIYQWMQTQPSVAAVYIGRPESATRWSGEGTVMCAPIPG